MKPLLTILCVLCLSSIAFASPPCPADVPQDAWARYVANVESGKTLKTPEQAAAYFRQHYANDAQRLAELDARILGDKINAAIKVTDVQLTAGWLRLRPIRMGRTPSACESGQCPTDTIESSPPLAPQTAEVVEPPKVVTAPKAAATPKLDVKNPLWQAPEQAPDQVVAKPDQAKPDQAKPEAVKPDQVAGRRFWDVPRAVRERRVKAREARRERRQERRAHRRGR